MLHYIWMYHDNFGVFKDISCGAEIPVENLQENKTMGEKSVL